MVLKPCFGLWFWGPTALHQLMPHLRSTKKLDKIIHQLTILREVWPRIYTSSCIQAFNVVADGLDDLVDELSPGSAPVPGFTKTEKALLGLFAAAFLVGASVQVGVHLGRHSCPAPNLERVGP